MDFEYFDFVFVYVFVFVLTSGLFAGVSLDGELMTTRGYCNEMYYGKKLSVKDILSSTTRSNDNGITWKQDGKARMLRRNRDYETLIQMLNDYCVDEHLDNNNYIPPPMNTPNYSFNKKQDDKYKPINGSSIEKRKAGQGHKRRKSGSESGSALSLGSSPWHQHRNGNAKKIDSSKYLNGNRKGKKSKSKKKKKEEDYPFEYREDQEDMKEDEDQYEEEYEEEYYDEVEFNNDNDDNDPELELGTEVNHDNVVNNGNSYIWDSKVY